MLGTGRLLPSVLHSCPMLGTVKLLPSVMLRCPHAVGSLAVGCQHISTTPNLCEIRKLARLRVVDNSSIGRAAMAAGKPPRVIHVYTKTGVGYLGDKVLVAVKGQKKRGYLVGLKQKQKANIPRFDSNNVVLIEDNGLPSGTRIKAPIPSVLRGKGGDFTKLLALATKFV